VRESGAMASHEMKVAGGPVDAGREAMERHAWNEAFELLTEADRLGQLDGDGLAMLRDAAWWAGRFRDAIEAGERAFSVYAAAGENVKAARMALKVAIDHHRSLSKSVSAGWFARAERLLANEPESAVHGALAREQAYRAYLEGDLERALELAETALDIGTRMRDRDVQALALQLKGMVLVGKGQVEEGLALQDEATVAAVSGELEPFTTGVVYCNVIWGASNMGDYRRAGDWTEAAKRWCERQSINGFPGVCRVHRAEIMRLRGAWADAEDEAKRACTELSDFGFLYIAADAFYELGEIRLRMGELALAEEAFRQANEFGREPLPGLAVLRLVEGKTDAALSAINRAVADGPEDPLFRAKLLPAQVRIALAAREVETARKAVEELEGVASTYGTPALHAMAATARGALQTAEGEPGEARRSLRRAVALWREVDLPYEVAEARVLLGMAYRAAGEEDAATMELDAARSSFERLGAPRDAKRVTELMGDSDAAAAGAPRVERAFMFTDIVRSTNLVEAIGDDAWTNLVRWHDQTLRVCFQRNEGEEVDHAGDGFFVAFENAKRALTCAIEIQRKLLEHRRTAGFAPQVRIGVHVAEAARHGDDYLGKGVHEAARIGALAGGEEIVVSAATIEAAGDGFTTKDSRTAPLKGIAEPVEVVSVEWR
jgi:class 3 adenylate cyclase